MNTVAIALQKAVCFGYVTRIAARMPGDSIFSRVRKLQVGVVRWGGVGIGMIGSEWKAC